jgi:hypothetical protein
MNLIETLQHLVNSTWISGLGLNGNRLMKGSLEFKFEGFSNICLKIKNGEAKFEFFLVYLQFINHKVNA